VTRDSHRLRSPLPRSFYIRPTLIVARDLLGKYLVRRVRKKLLIGKIVEVEGYLGEKDPASHSYRGKTKRNEVMFKEGGHLYVYFTYGMHFCCNVVTEEEGKGRAVLLRAVEPLEGIEVMRKNRRFDADRKDYWNLTNGPAKLCEAFGIRREMNGVDLTSGDLFLMDGQTINRSAIGTSGRIGIKDGREKEWRFFVRRNPFVSS
jgi:DNA-3-methyladenine glycosylase